MDDRKITVAVCGDSFCTASINDLQVTGTGRRAHFSQMLEDVYGYKVVHLAHGGFSNAGILFQIFEASKMQVDVVVYASSWSNRLELHTYNRRFNANNTLKNFHYWDPHVESSQLDITGDKSAPVLSVTHQNLDKNPFLNVSAEQMQAVELYQKYLYVPEIHDVLDTWLFEYWHDLLVRKKILPIRFKDPEIGKIAYDFSVANPNYDTPFHTDRATQEQIADNVHRYIVDNLPKLV